MVQEFVRVGHFDLDRTKTLLTQEPGLLNATWDWGGGDWETALGGAGHMGRKDIALFLISSGARMDIFHAAMLGRLDIVKPVLTAFPNLAASKGPHGIPLIAHAQKVAKKPLPSSASWNLFPSQHRRSTFTRWGHAIRGKAVARV